METAYANIGLDANNTWRDVPGDGFQKSSDKLWAKLNYLKEKKHHQVGEKGKVVTVHDVIPQSKLALYGNYSYDNDREMMYNKEKALQFCEEVTKSQGAEVEEPWMAPEVEQEFRRLTRHCSLPYDLYNGFKPVDCVEVEESIQKKYPVLAKKCQPHAIDAEETLETIFLPNPFYRINDLNQLELQMRITSTKNIWEHPIRNLAALMETQTCGQQMRCGPFSDVESFTVRNLPNENKPSSQSFPFGAAPSSQTPFAPCLRFAESSVDLAARRTFRTSVTTENTEDAFSAAKKRSTSDFASFSLLARAVNPAEVETWETSAFQVPETVIKWLQTGYPTRSKEFSAIQTLGDELRSFRSSLQTCQISTSAKDRRKKTPDGNFGGKKYDFFPGTNLGFHLEGLVYGGDQLSGSPSSSSSSERSQARTARPNSAVPGKLQFPPVPEIRYSPDLRRSRAPNRRTPKLPDPVAGDRPDGRSPRDGPGRKFAGNSARCRPILSSQRGEVFGREATAFDAALFRKESLGGMADMKTLRCCGETSFDDLERQAIEQWPSEDAINVFYSKRLQ